MSFLCAQSVREEGGNSLRIFSSVTTRFLSDSTPFCVINYAVSWLVRKEALRSQAALCRGNHV